MIPEPQGRARVQGVRVTADTVNVRPPAPLDWRVNPVNNRKHFVISTMSPTSVINGLTYYVIPFTTPPDRITIKNSTSIDWFVGLDVSEPPTLAQFSGYVHKGRTETFRLVAGENVLMLLPFLLEGNFSGVVEVYAFWGPCAIPEPSLPSTVESADFPPTSIPSTSTAAGAYLNVISPQIFDLLLDEMDFTISSGGSIALADSYLGDTIIRQWTTNTAYQPYRFDLGGYRLLRGHTFRIKNVGTNALNIGANIRARQAL